LALQDAVVDGLQCNPKPVDLVGGVGNKGSLHTINDLNDIGGRTSIVGQLQGIEEAKIKDVEIGGVGWMALEEDLSRRQVAIVLQVFQVGKDYKIGGRAVGTGSILLNLDLELRVRPITNRPVLHDSWDHIIKHHLSELHISHATVMPNSCTRRPVNICPLCSPIVANGSDTNLAIPISIGGRIPSCFARAQRNITALGHVLLVPHPPVGCLFIIHKKIPFAILGHPEPLLINLDLVILSIELEPPHVDRVRADLVANELEPPFLLDVGQCWLEGASLLLKDHPLL
jgi:hypothetical protein